MIDIHCKRLRERHLLRELRLPLIGRNNWMKVYTYNQPTLLPVLLVHYKAAKMITDVNHGFQLGHIKTTEQWDESRSR